MIREGEVSAGEVVEAYLAQIVQHNGRLNAIVTLDAAGARRQARQADETLARGGPPVGPLHGVPITIKDALEVGGMRTTFGCRWTRHHVPTADAPLVARLRAAGAIVLGKSNIPECSFDWQTVSPIFGQTVNPWDPTRTPGGSSGGGAAAVAAGLSALDAGSDGAGSIRLPAHFCGLFAFNPTAHRVPGGGHMRLPRTPPGGARNVLSFGFVARSVEDLRLALEATAGPEHPGDFDVPPVPLDTPSGRPLGARRIAWTSTLPGLPANRETRAAIQSAANVLARTGCQVENCAPEFDPTEALHVWGRIAGAEFGTQTPPHLRPMLRLIFEPLFGQSAVVQRLCLRPGDEPDALHLGACTAGRARAGMGSVFSRLRRVFVPRGRRAGLCPPYQGRAHRGGRRQDTLLAGSGRLGNPVQPVRGAVRRAAVDPIRRRSAHRPATDRPALEGHRDAGRGRTDRARGDRRLSPAARSVKGA
jgi:amidase